MKFKYSALDVNSVCQKGEIEAESSEEAHGKLRAQQLYPTKITKIVEKKPKSVDPETVASPSEPKEDPSLDPDSLAHLLASMFGYGKDTEDSPRSSLQEFTQEVKKQMGVGISLDPEARLGIAIAMGCKVIADAIVEKNTAGPKVIRQLFGDSFQTLIKKIVEKLDEPEEGEGWKTPDTKPGEE